MPLNQPGGGVAPAEAYEVYSALYQAPMHEQLVFAEDSETDIPQVNGSCLQPGSSQEKEMTDAFVAANQQSHRWEQKFSIPQGYRLLPHAEIAQAQTCLANTARAAPRNAPTISKSDTCGFWAFQDLTTHTHGHWSR